jgi:chromosome segregation ATPase
MGTKVCSTDTLPQNTTHEDNSAGSEPTATTNGHPQTNGHTEDDNAPAEDANAEPRDPQSSLTAAKLEAMSQGREALRVEVEQLRRQLETIQSAHSKEVSQLRSELEESEAAKDHAETQYQTLLTRVEKIKETLGDRLKRDRAELEEAKDRIEELEALNEQSQTDQRNVQEQFARLKEEMAEQEEELSRLRSRSNLSQQNWLKEKEGLESHTRHLKAELESATNAMGEWEVIAMEERSMRENLAEKVADLEEQLVSVREAYQRAAQERDTQSSAIDGLQRALQEIQEARKKELRDMVESSEEQLSALRRQAKEAETRASAAESERENLAKELERTVPFEKEVKEKNLLIGKLRHEAIVLNDHLTKALKYIKKTKPEETIDRYAPLHHACPLLIMYENLTEP